ncbi:tyrosine--tRNA ligase [Candidatus Woesebacteria bacterium]|nr:tyrosine--tRNA ligase [Candidatus Woesebacteria bacterium]
MPQELVTDPDKISQVLTRGVEQILPSMEALAKRMAESPIRLYLGIDPTGSDLTLGHSVVLRKLQQFAQLGHEVILLVGNGTVRIGDPTGRDSTRPELTDDQIMANFAHWQEQASKILDFSLITIKKNGDWLDQLTYIDMIKLLANTTVQQLIERDMFQKRLQEEKPIFGHEIIYPLIQGYDSVAMDVDLEIGGSDQLFNMMMGRSLQKTYNNKEKWVLTTPIINGTDGRKMSKSYSNYIALTEDPIQMYGKIMSVVDDQIIPYFTVLTDVELSEVEKMQQAMTAGENPMEFKKRLAFTITESYHNVALAREAQEHFERVVQQQTPPEDLPKVTTPSANPTVLELVGACCPALSRTEQRRLIEQGAVRLNDQKLQDFAATIAIKTDDILKVGKREYYQLVVTTT